MAKSRIMFSNQNIQAKSGGKWATKTISVSYHRFEDCVTKCDYSKIIDLKTYQKVQNLISENGGKPNFYNFP